MLKVHCGTPMIWTFKFSGAEYYCVKCGVTQGIFGSAQSVQWTAALDKEQEINKKVFHRISAACIPRGSRRKDCKKCDGQDHQAHASKTDLEKSDATYKLLAGGIEEEVFNHILEELPNATH